MVEETEQSPTSPTFTDGVELNKSNGMSRVFVHQLNMSSADILRRQRESEMVGEETARLKMVKHLQRRQKEEEKRRDMEMLQSYNPWNKPGAGAPMQNSKRTKIVEEHMGSNDQPNDDILGNTLTGFGRPGAGAPLRTKSGRTKTQISGDPDIRFQDAQHVRLSIENQLRYKNSDRDNVDNTQEKKIEQQLASNKQQMESEESKYEPWGKGCGNPERDEVGNVRRYKFSTSVQHGVLEPSSPSEDTGIALPLSNRGGNGAPQMTLSGNPKTRLRNTLEVSEISGHFAGNNAASPIEGEEDYNPWGKPGAGAPLKDNRAVGMDFMEKMGWSMSGNPKRRSQESKQNYLHDLLQKTEEKKNRDKMEKQHLIDDGMEVVSWIREKSVGRPRKDPVTGELLNHSRGVSDVTAAKLDIRRLKSDQSEEYHNYLTQQAEARRRQRQEQKEREICEQKQHLDTWNSLWGRGGSGAPLDPNNHHKPNFESLLNNSYPGEAEPYVKHYTQEVAPSKHRNGYELETNPYKIVTKDYEFRTPWPATI
ncbi:uncharacterized protein LOC106460011 isoform X2 [Limulus polyphemus]|uniref:Uncharacterized protein LOC106460011 isoform X2 n=1 Tax=Limulus polyphemus TaxID=6850 RepID=A0ABM1SFB0_LIMPO|nr:uncharacterized protein LOC106460011 isoform X2 [Limulus polyphemus]